jgi:hypothetical protein
MRATVEFIPKCDCPKGDDMYTVNDSGNPALWCPLCHKYWETRIVYHEVNVGKAVLGGKP